MKYLSEKQHFQDVNNHYYHILQEEDYEHPLPPPYVYIETIKEEINPNIELNTKKNFLLTKLDIYHLMSGAFAGIVSRTFTAPLDRLKILYQVMYSNKNVSPPGIKDGLKQIYQNDGIKGLFRGNLINVIKACPDTMLKFFFFEKFKNFFKGKDTHLSLTKTFMAGTSAGIFSYSIIFPFDVIKTRLCGAPKGTYDGLIDSIRKIYRYEGIKGFYKGLKVSVCSVVPAIGLNLTIYETLKKVYNHHFNTNNNTPTLLYMIFGGLSSLTSSALLYPTQLIQTRIIMNGVLNNYVSPSVINITRNIYKMEGFIGFYKGFMPAITKIIIGNGITFGAYEKCKQFMIDKNYFDDN